mmetsp:Transcript_21032/g.66444  ORF Transcript_21032/g.66444 Transcript_21032/m.66444 type:complete len:231 (-) Transcript_21032:244-936(-)
MKVLIHCIATSRGSLSSAPPDSATKVRMPRESGARRCKISSSLSSWIASAWLKRSSMRLESLRRASPSRSTKSDEGVTTTVGLASSTCCRPSGARNTSAMARMTFANAWSPLVSRILPATSRSMIRYCTLSQPDDSSMPSRLRSTRSRTRVPTSSFFNVTVVCPTKGSPLRTDCIVRSSYTATCTSSKSGRESKEKTKRLSKWAAHPLRAPRATFKVLVRSVWSPKLTTA